MHFAGFRHGRPSGTGGAAARAVLEPHCRTDPGEPGFLHLSIGDGGADVYLRPGDPDHMMVNHVAGDDPWSLLVEAARTADWVILLPGGTAAITALTSPDQREHLPAGWVTETALVSSGADLLAVIQSS